MDPHAPPARDMAPSARHAGAGGRGLVRQGAALRGGIVARMRRKPVRQRAASGAQNRRARKTRPRTILARRDGTQGIIEEPAGEMRRSSTNLGRRGVDRHPHRIFEFHLKPLASRLEGGGRYRVRTCDPYHVKVKFNLR